MATLSFAVTTPGTTASDADVTGFLQRIRAAVVPSIADLSSLKNFIRGSDFDGSSFEIGYQGGRCFCEKDGTERDARLAQQRALLRGLDITGPTEPAHSLYHLCSDMIEKNTTVYISPSKCMSRQQELAGSKPEKEIQLDASKTALVVKEQPSSTDISIASDLALYPAIQRRRLAHWISLDLPFMKS